MVRGIDHAVLASRDLQKDAALFESLGFHVGARNRHPWGTENQLIVLQNGFLELLALGADFRRPVVRKSDTEFAALASDFLPERTGWAMLAFTSQDAAADARGFAAAGQGDADAFSFEREVADRPGETTGFTLAFARDRLLEHVGLFTCEHRTPLVASIAHANTATRLLGAALVADDPADHADFLSGVTGQKKFEATSIGLELPLAGHQTLDVLSPLGFQFRFGVTPSFAEPRLAAIRIGVSDLQQTRAHLRAAGFAPRELANGLALEAGAGATLLFEPDAAPR